MHCFPSPVEYEKDDSKTRAINQNLSYGGTIWGYTGDHFDTWGSSPVPFASVDGGKTTYSSPIIGMYRTKNLPLGTYTIIGSKKGYTTFTDNVTLTVKRPDKQVFIHMEPNDESVNKATSIMPLFLSLLQQYPSIHQLVQRYLRLKKPNTIFF